jgi:hypothetical protein
MREYEAAVMAAAEVAAERRRLLRERVVYSIRANYIGGFCRGP